MATFTIDRSYVMGILVKLVYRVNAMANKLNFTGSYEQRALIAYTRSDGHEKAIQVCKFFKKKYQGRLYLVLTNMVRGIMATYRIQNDGSLRRMIRTPKQVIDSVPNLNEYDIMEIMNMMEPYAEALGMMTGDE